MQFFPIFVPNMKKVKVIAPTHLNGEITLPISKSIASRVLIIKRLIHLFPSNTYRTLPPSPTLLDNYDNGCEDIRILTQALNQVSTSINAEEMVIDTGSSGTAMRFMTAFLSLLHGNFILTGSDRMKERPIAPLVEAMRKLGCKIDYLEQDGFPPLTINGGISHSYTNSLSINASISSQFISALLLIAPILKNGLTLHLQGEIASKPYIDLTIDVMKRFGARIDWTDMNTISVAGSPYENCNFDIEGDWTAASYWYEIMTLKPDSKIIVNNLNSHSIQGDAIVPELMNKIKIHHSNQPNQPFMFDFRNNPDLVQTAAATCFGLGMSYHFTGTDNLRYKETNRIAALNNELNKLRQGNYCISTYNDHRMAMAFAPLALKFPYIIIENPEVVNKSYPTYWDDLYAVGFKISE